MLSSCCLHFISLKHRHGCKWFVHHLPYSSVLLSLFQTNEHRNSQSTLFSWYTHTHTHVHTYKHTCIQCIRVKRMCENVIKLWPHSLNIQRVKGNRLIKLGAGWGTNIWQLRHLLRYNQVSELLLLELRHKWKSPSLQWCKHTSLETSLWRQLQTGGFSHFHDEFSPYSTHFLMFLTLN